MTQLGDARPMPDDRSAFSVTLAATDGDIAVRRHADGVCGVDAVMPIADAMPSALNGDGVTSAFTNGETPASRRQP
jgi:hypothetical protein